MADPNAKVRFTPDELKQMVSDNALKQGDMEKMHPDDVKMMNDFFNAGDYPDPKHLKESPGLKLGAGAMMAGGAAVPLGVGGAIGAIPAAAGAAARNPLVSGGIGLGASQLLPPGVARSLAEMMSMMRMMGGGGAPAAEAEATTRMKPAKGAQTINPMTEAEYAAQAGHPRGQFWNTPEGNTGGSMPRLDRPNLDQTRTFGQATENMRQGGARVEGVTPPPAAPPSPPNLSTLRTFGQATENVRQGGARVDGVTPPAKGEVGWDRLNTTEKSSKIKDVSSGSMKLEQLLDLMYGKNRKTEGNGTYKEPVNFSKDEFPSGTSPKSSPKDFLDKSNESANKQVSQRSVDKTQSKISSDLGPSKLRKPKK